MNIQQLIAKANKAHAANDISLAMGFLKQAGEAGDINAALDYAYYLSHDKPIESVQYLESLSCVENPIVQYHKLLIAYFCDLITESNGVAKSLVALGQKGVIEAYLVILSYLEQSSSEFSFIANKVRNIAPNIFNQLKLDEFVNSKVCESNNDKVAQGLESKLFEPLPLPITLNEELPISLFESTLSGFECNYLITKFSALLQPSMVVDPITGQGRIDKVRTSYVAIISPEHCDWLTRKIDKLVAKATKTRCCEGEVLNLLRYVPGQEYKPHYDALNRLHDAKTFEDGGQRTKTAIIYLNTVNEGGNTTFPKLGMRVSPNKGNMLVFNNSDDKGNVLINSYHAGESTQKENKWLVTKWIREHKTNYGKFLYGNH
ncbi:prolyl hydroxylase family protein [Alteromonas naphthalenivorans]|uniref:Prolyl 4-hydroxylase subunit alpha n=1 Tax=Alteromonas naphthalenivorans TaxID=715451 RepID=F5ZDZ8_ALTNA|nr:2OG-Fe(II) oxygenase [Alteromonas naphthalenivorans]AEF04110.1 Prolyl 4-hydroxylase subunit alpha [Alteromonas naphthalenivorans]